MKALVRSQSAQSYVLASICTLILAGCSVEESATPGTEAPQQPATAEVETPEKLPLASEDAARVDTDPLFNPDGGFNFVENNWGYRFCVFRQMNAYSYQGYIYGYANVVATDWIGYYDYPGLPRQYRPILLFTWWANNQVYYSRYMSGHPGIGNVNFETAQTVGIAPGLYTARAGAVEYNAGHVSFSNFGYFRYLRTWRGPNNHPVTYLTYVGQQNPAFAIVMQQDSCSLANASGNDLISGY